MPNINHLILVWARETAELPLEEAAKKLQIRDSAKSSAADKLLAYEKGMSAPTRAMLVKMAKTYRRPLLTFYLDRPPLIGDRGEDFRTLPDHFEGQQNAYVDMMIRDVKARQSLIRETLVEEDEGTALTFVGKNTLREGVESITQTLQEVLNLDLAEFRAQTKYENAFKILRQRAEQAGVFVLLQGNLGSHHTNIDVTAFRGFALSDEVAPFIIINNRDAKSAWAFTLLHEMAHIVLGQTGVSGAHAEKQIEKFCNDVASEYLLPSDEFKNFKPSSLEFETISEEIRTYAFANKVSRSHVAYRLFRTGNIDKALWEKLRDHYRQQWREQRDINRARNQKKDSGPNFYVVKRHNLGALVNLVQRFTYSGALSTTKAGMLLGMRPLKVHNIFSDHQPA